MEDHKYCIPRSHLFSRNIPRRPCLPFPPFLVSPRKQKQKEKGGSFSLAYYYSAKRSWPHSSLLLLRISLLHARSGEGKGIVPELIRCPHWKGQLVVIIVSPLFSIEYHTRSVRKCCWGVNLRRGRGNFSCLHMYISSLSSARTCFDIEGPRKKILFFIFSPIFQFSRLLNSFPILPFFPKQVGRPGRGNF